MNPNNNQNNSYDIVKSPLQQLVDAKTQLDILIKERSELDLEITDRELEIKKLMDETGLTRIAGVTKKRVSQPKKVKTEVLTEKAKEEALRAER